MNKGTDTKRADAYSGRSPNPLQLHKCNVSYCPYPPIIEFLTSLDKP